MAVIEEIIKKRKIIFIVCIFCVLIISSVAYAKHINVDKHTQSNTEQIEEFIKKAIGKGKISGLAVGIVKNGETIYEKGFGYADIEERTPVTSATLFEIGSNSKAFTALGILTLIKDGFININDPVTKYIPWLETKYEGRIVPITIDQLLHQTSGIPFNSIDMIPQLEGINALEETVKTLIDQELDTMPGEKFQYATINYDVLGLLIEKVTGMSYEEYMTENVFNVMKLEETYLNRDDIKNLDIATGYKMQFFEPHKYIAPIYDGNKPAGYIISNLNDMEKWLNIQLGVSKENSFSMELIKQSQEANRRVKPTSGGASYADGWFVYQEGGGELSHGGENPNYSSYIILIPEEKIGIVVLSNINSGYTSIIADGINDILKGNEPKDYVKDQNIILDKAAVIIICIVGLLIIFLSWALIKLFVKLIKNELSFEKINAKNIIKIIISLCFMSIICYCIFKIPYIFFNGISWNFVFVWRPNNLKYALYLIYIFIGISYIYILISNFCKKKTIAPSYF